MRLWLTLAVAALARLGVVRGAQYDGEFCTAVVDFPLKDGLDFAKLDQQAVAAYEVFPWWVTRGCLAAVWRYSCMATYGKTAEDEGGYCRASCQSTLFACQKTLDVLPKETAAYYVNLLDVLCQYGASTDENCHPGAEVQYDDIPEGYGTVCPNPLGTVKPESDASTARIPGSACNTGCPSIILTHDEWDQLGDIGMWCTLCSAILSLIVVLSHREEKNLFIRYLNFGAMLVNMVLFAFLLTEKYVPQTCLEDGYYHKHSDFCYFQAAITIGGFLWLSSWQACIAINLWLSVVVQAKRQVLEKARSLFLPVCTSLAIISPAICLAGHNIGYDWAGYSGPVCLFLFSEESAYYWALLFVPVAIVVIVCLTLTIHTTFHVNSVLVNSKAANDTFFARVGKMLKYNKRLVLFICCFALMSGFECSLILYENLSPDAEGVKSSAEEYIECLLENTLQDPNTGMDECGKVPKQRPSLWRIAAHVLYATTIGIMSFLVYGTQNKMQQSISSSVRSIRSLRSGAKTTEAKHLMNDTANGSATDAAPPEPTQSGFMDILRSSFVSLSRLTGMRESELQIELPQDHSHVLNGSSSHDGDDERKTTTDD